MEPKPPLQGKPLRRKVHVVYYLSRGGQMDHPHLLEGYLTAAQDGLRLRDFKRWLAGLRGKSMPTSFAWSYKRNYKSGFIWHDLGDNDLIQPLCKNEYVLMGSEIVRDAGMEGKCKCGSVQQTDRKTSDRLDSEVKEAPMNTRSTIMSSPKLVSKSTLSSPKLDNKSTAYQVDQINSIDVARQCKSLNNSGWLVAESSETNQYHDKNKTICKSMTSVSRGSSSRSLEVTAQRLLEEVKRPTNHITSKHVAVNGSQNYNMIQNGGSSSLRDCEIMANDQGAFVMLELTSDNQQLHDMDKVQWEGNGANYMKQLSPMYRSRGVYHDGINSEMTGDVDDHIYQDNEVNCTNIVDAATQTGDSTRCSTDCQESMSSHGHLGFENLRELVCSPRGSTRYSDVGTNGYIVGDGSIIKRVSSAGNPKGSLSKQLSKGMSQLPDVEKALMINNSSDFSSEINPAPTNHLVSSSNTSMHNNIGSPALSTCSAMSGRSTRFAREENYTCSASKPVKPDHHHHHHGKGSLNISTSAPSSAPTLLKQILTCGNADGDVKEAKSTTDQVIMKSNALSTVQTPGRVISTSKYPVSGGIDMNDKRGGRNSHVWTCKPGMMKRNVSTSSDSRSVISATASDTLELMSSPDSVHSNGRMKSIMRAKSLVSSVNISGTSMMPLSRGEAVSRGQQLRLNNTANAASATSPCSSTSRRSSIRETDTNMSGDLEGLTEAMRGHSGATSVNPTMRTNKGNKNTTLSIGGILNGQVPHEDQSRSDKRIEPDNMVQNRRSGPPPSSTSVSELHKLICNPSGTPTTNHCSKMITANLTKLSLEQMPIIHDDHCHHTICKGLNNKRPSQSHKILLSPHDQCPIRTPTRPCATLHFAPSTILSKSLNSPNCSSTFLEEGHRRPSSSYISSWKDLLWSPRYHSSHKEKDKRRMKP